MYGDDEYWLEDAERFLAFDLEDRKMAKGGLEDCGHVDIDGVVHFIWFENPSGIVTRCSKTVRLIKRANDAAVTCFGCIAEGA